MRRVWMTPLLLSLLLLAAGAPAYPQSAPIPATNFPEPPLNTLTDQESGRVATAVQWQDLEGWNR